MPCQIRLRPLQSVLSTAMAAADSFPLPRAEVSALANLTIRLLTRGLVQLIALFLESLLFGAFAVLYFISIWILMYREHRHGRSKLNKWMLATATTMFVLAIAVSCTPFQRAL